MRLTLIPTTSLLALATAAAMVPAAPALAQATGNIDSVTPAIQPVETVEVLEEIVITAQRRSESLQDVPLSVATINDETLAAIQAGGADVRGLAGRVPSLNIESSFGRTFPRFYIRGLGNTDFDLNASQPVSLVYDDVVLESPILKGFPAFDLDRIEVLRGPQGTLFGRNSRRASSSSTRSSRATGTITRASALACTGPPMPRARSVAA